MKIQTAQEGYVLYKDDNESRIYAHSVVLPDTTDEWQECTIEEKEQWEAEHTVPETTKEE